MRKKGIETLETIDLTKAYNGRIVVDRVSLKIRAGEVVGLLGPNGAGKTTTFYMIIGLVRPDRGKVLFNGKNIGELPMYQRARRGITYLPQEPSVFRKLTVEENILAILETLNLVREDQERRLQGLLKELNIAHLAKHKAFSLSGGERRRVEITRALVLSPSLILLDEPFAGIDPLAVIDIQNIIRQLKKRGIGVIVTDHNVREALHVCDRAYILNEGKILEAGSPKKIAASKKAREIYLGEHFRLEQRGREKKGAESPKTDESRGPKQKRAQSQKHLER
jgi:lipopolysaccharide export system ATP-binding protein